MAQTRAILPIHLLPLPPFLLRRRLRPIFLEWLVLFLLPFTVVSVGKPFFDEESFRPSNLTISLLVLFLDGM